MKIFVTSIVNRFDIRTNSAKSTDKVRNHSAKSTVRSWSTKWIIDKNAFRIAVKRFKQTITLNRFASITSEDSSFINVISELFSSSTSQSSDITEKMKRIIMSDQKNVRPASAFITVQKRKLIVIMIEVLRNQFTSSFSDENGENSNDNRNNDFNNHRPALIIRSVENVEFFNFNYVDINNFVIVNAGRHIFYKDVYVFENKLKNLTKNFIEEQRMKKLVSECLRGEIFKWYFMKMTKFEKNFLRTVFIEQWINAFIKRFKKRDVAALQTLQTERYIMNDVRSERTSRVYVQNIMKHVKAAEFSSSYNQMFTAWNNLNLKF